MDNHGQNGKDMATGSSEKLLPSAPTSTSPFPPDVSFNAGNNEKSTMAAAAAAAAAARHTELLQAQQAAALRASQAPPPPPNMGRGMPSGPTNNATDDTLTDFDKLGVAMPHARTEDISKFGTLLLSAISILLVLVTLPFSLCYCVKVVQEYERAVIFRLGRLKKGGASGPGLFFILPCIDNYRCVDLRTVSYEVPPQEMLSRDSVTVSVDAVCFYKISNPLAAVCNVGNYTHSTNLLVATSLRNVLGTKTLAEILSERETICHVMEHILDEATRPWGVKVERVEIKDVRVPVQLQRAMAAEAEAAREARAKVVAAEGEQKASTHLKEAALVLEESKSALQLRYLQTLNAISTEQSSTIVFPFPIDSLSLSMGVGKEKNKKE